jgi:hypothetical protein
MYNSYLLRLSSEGKRGCTTKGNDFDALRLLDENPWTPAPEQNLIAVSYRKKIGSVGANADLQVPREAPIVSDIEVHIPICYEGEIEFSIIAHPNNVTLASPALIGSRITENSGEFEIVTCPMYVPCGLAYTSLHVRLSSRTGHILPQDKFDVWVQYTQLQTFQRRIVFAMNNWDYGARADPWGNVYRGGEVWQHRIQNTRHIGDFEMGFTRIPLTTENAVAEDAEGS